MEWSGVEAMTESRAIVERYDEYGVPMWEGKGREGIRRLQLIGEFIPGE